MQRILLIDHDDCFRKMIRLMLAKLGYDVVEARNRAEALKLNQYLPSDLVLADMVTPEKEGLQTVRELKQKNPTLRIVAMLGGDRAGDTRNPGIAQVLGVHRVLAKPFSNEEIKMTLSDVMAWA